MPRVLAICAREHFDQLKCFGELPPHLWTWIDDAKAAAECEPEADSIHVISPDLLSELAQSHADIFGQLMSQFYDHRVFSLVIHDERQSGGGRLWNWSDIPTARDEVSQFESVIHWHEQLKTCLLLASLGRHRHLQSDLVVVAVTDISNVDSFLRLTQQPIFNRCFVMLAQLEPAYSSDTESRHTPFYASHVWPSSLCGLLLCQLISDDNVALQSKPVCYSWRTFFLAPETDPETTDRLLERIQRDFVKALTSQDLWFEYEPVVPARIESTQPVSKRGPLFEDAPWYDSDLDQMKRHPPQSCNVDKEFVARLSQHSLQVQANRLSQQRRFWSAVRTRFHFLFEKSSTKEKPTVALDRGWLTVREIDLELERSESQLGIERSELKSAQDGFLSMVVRGSVALATAAAVGVFLFTITYAILDSLVWASVSIGFAIAGSFAAAIAGWVGENRDGQRAFRRLVRQNESIDRLREARHQGLIDFYQSGLRSKDSQESVSLQFRHRWLRERIIRLFEAAWAGGLHDGESSPFGEPDMSRQREKFLSETVLKQPLRFDLEDDSLLSPLLAELQREWKSSWEACCQSADPESWGHFPASALYRHFLEFANRFSIRVRAHLCNMSIENSSEGLEGKWIEMLRDKLSAAYWGAHSCHFHRKDLSPGFSAACTPLYVQSGLEKEGFNSVLHGAQDLPISEVKSTAVLSDVPAIGLVCETFPVQFVRDEETGKLVVGFQSSGEP